jgi:hypothetical protein
MFCREPPQAFHNSETQIVAWHSHRPMLFLILKHDLQLWNCLKLSQHFSVGKRC